MDSYEGALVLPVVPNWATAVEDEWSYKTDIFKTRAGHETRRALRAKPRRSLGFSVLLAKQHAAAFRHRLAKGVNAKMVIADPTRRLVGVFTAPGSVSSVALSDVPHWLRTGEPVAIVTGKSVQVRKVLSTIDMIVVFDAPVTVEDRSLLCPAVIGRITAEQQIQKPTDSVVRATIDFSEDPTTALDPLDPLAEEDIPSYRDYPLLLIRPNWSSAFTERFGGTVDILDYDFGKLYDHQVESEGRWSGSYACLARDTTQTQAALDFFFRRKGRRGGFYAPTWQDDLTVLSGFTAGSETLTAAGTDAHDLFTDSLVYRNLALFTGPNSVVPIGIKSAAIAGGNTVITLDAPLPAGLGTLEKCSWLLFVRFASDQFSVTWRTDQVSQFNINVAALFDNFYEMTINGERVTFDHDYLIFPPFAKSTAPVFSITMDGEHVLISGDHLL